MAVTRIAAVLLVVGLVVGTGTGYGIGFMSYQSEISRLHTNLSTAESEIDSLETQVSSLKSERSDLEVQVSNLVLEVSDLRSDLENTLGTVTTLKTIISAMINQSAVTPAYIRLYDEELGFGFEYPEDWETHVEDGPFPDKDIKKVVTCNLYIYGEPIFCVEIESKIESTNFTDLKDVKEELRKELNMSGVPILNESTIVVNNREGYDLLAGTSFWRLRQVVFLANGMAYMFKFQSQEEFYRIYEETFDHVINSFIIE